MPTLAEVERSTLRRPRILCLHGGGTNASVLRLQARTYITLLAPHFRLVFADAPFLADPHPDIVPVYEDQAPFRAWYRWRADQAVCGGGDGASGEDGADNAGGVGQRVLDAWNDDLRAAMHADDELGATGDWVGLLGFSQGARVAASLLLESQLRLELQIESLTPTPAELTMAMARSSPPGFAGGRWRFGVLLAGRGPLLAVSAMGRAAPGIETLTGYSPTSELRADGQDEEDNSRRKRLALPTVHVHGLADDGLAFHRQLRSLDCDARSSLALEWVGGHRLGFRTADVEPVVKAILKIARDLGL